MNSILNNSSSLQENRSHEKPDSDVQQDPQSRATEAVRARTAVTKVGEKAAAGNQTTAVLFDHLLSIFEKET